MALTPKQEAFCLAVVSGKNISDAYRSAYNASGMKPASINRQAKSLSDDPKIASRIAFLRKPVVEAVQYGLKEAMQEAEEALKVARGKENGGAMVAAVTLRSKLSGLLVDKKEVRTGPLDGLPLDVVLALRDALTAGTAPNTQPGGESRTTH